VPPTPFILIVQRDDGMWSVGWHDDAPGKAVAVRTSAVLP
jgi:hypothetical protein